VAAAPKTSPMHPKRWLCTAFHVLDVGGVISQLNERLRTPRRSQSGDARAEEEPCNVGWIGGTDHGFTICFCGEETEEREIGRDFFASRIKLSECPLCLKGF
jgi:hypothetical protein